MSDATRRSAPGWLLALGALGLVLIGGGLGYAVWIGIANFGRIGV
jgi:hypothetical protein